MNAFLQNVVGFFFQAGAESCDFIAAQSNVNLGDLWAGRELAQSANQDRHAAKFGELFGRHRLLALEDRARGHARPHSCSRNNYDHLHGGLQVYEAGCISSNRLTVASVPACFILERNPMADSIHIKLPDGSVKDVPKGSTALDVAKSVGQRLADAALAAKTNGDLIDLTRPLEKDSDLRILTERDPEALEVYRHSSAHLLAAAVLELFPETKLGHGPATETGFFYDFYRPTAFTPEDLQ